MKTIFKGNKFSIVWEIFHNTTRLPFDFTGMNIEVSLTSNSYSSVLSNFNVKENVISTEIEANSLTSGVYDILCRFSTLNEQAYCFYKNAFHISNNPCFCDKSEKIEISTYATYVTPDALLTQFNSIYLTYLGNPKNTRNNIPEGMRRKGLIITYTNESNETITERATSDAQKDNDHWGLDTNWSRIDELSLSGDLSVSANGTWIINGKDTQIKAVGPKGDTGITPWLKTIDNRLYYSYDGKNWEACSEEIAAFFRFKSTREESNGATIGNIQISRDNKNWQDLSPEFVNHLRISAYVSTKDELPTNKPVGTMYGVGPTYKEEDTARANPIYRIYVYDGTTWVDNGSFTSIAAGIVQETGDSETLVMSQKVVTEKLSELAQEAGTLKLDIKGKLYTKIDKNVSGFNVYPLSVSLIRNERYNLTINLDYAATSQIYWEIRDSETNNLFSRRTIEVGELNDSYEFITENDYYRPSLAIYCSANAPSLSFVIDKKGLEDDIINIEEEVDGFKADNLEQSREIYALSNRVENLDGFSEKQLDINNIGIRRFGYYIHNVSGVQESSSLSIITNAIYLIKGSKITAYTKGDGFAIIARSSNEPDDNTVYEIIKKADNLTAPVEYVVEQDGYYSFSGRNQEQGDDALTVNVITYIQNGGQVKEISDKVDNMYQGKINETSYTLDDLMGEGANINYYLHQTSLYREEANNCIITKPIYLHAGDKVSCSTGGDGVCLFARTPSGVIDHYVTDCISISGAAKSYSGKIVEDGWYVFSGRINRTDGTNLKVNITAYTREKSVYELIDEKADKSEIGGSSKEVVAGSGFAVSVGADSVKDAIPASPWFNEVPNDGLTYGNYLDDKIDSVPQGDSFIFISDAHYKWNRKHSAKLIDYVRRRLGIKTIIHGGDVLEEAPNMYDAAKEWMDFNRDFVFRIGGDFKQVCGDHDHNGRYADTGQALSYQFIQRMINGYNIKELHYDTLYDEQVKQIASANGWTENEKKEYDAWKKMHYYFDDNTIQTRFIVLHTGWTGDVGLAVDKLGSNALSEAYALYLQMDFLYDTLMSCPENYNVVVVGHNVIGNKSYTATVDGSGVVRYNVNEPIWKGAWVNVAMMVKAFKNKKTISLAYRDWSGSGVQSKEFDFIQARTPNVVLCMGGDVHWDILSKYTESGSLEPVTIATSVNNIIPTEGTISKTDILHVLTMTDGSDREYMGIIAPIGEGYNDATDSVRISNPNADGTLDAQAFDIVTITENAVHFTRIGSANDRVVYISE